MFYNPHKKITLLFLILTLCLIILTFIFFITKEGRIIIIVKPRPEKSLLEKSVVIPKDIPGKILEFSAEEEKIFSPQANLEIESPARGEIEIINKTSQTFNFVKKTRFLATNNILFRLEKQTFVPANGKVRAIIYADRAGPESEIEPTRLTIPGLPINLQSQVYGESKERIRGGLKKIGLITEKDIDEANKNIESVLNEKIEKVIQEKIKEDGINLIDWKVILGDKNLTLETDAKPGEERGEFTVKGKMRVVLVIFNEPELLNYITKVAHQSVGQDKKIKNIEPHTLKYELKKLNLVNKTADIDIEIKISTIIKENYSIFDLTKIKALETKEIKNFLEQYKEIETVSVIFDPFWQRKMPKNDNLIIIKIKE